MNTAGWLLTENGRQPWIVQGLMKTEDGVSRRSAPTEVVISLVVVRAAVRRPRASSTWSLMLRYARRGLELEPDERADEPAPSRASRP